MSRRLLFLLIPVFIFLILGFSVYSFYKFVQPSAEINGHKFQLEIVKTEKDKQIGLSKYKSLPQDHAMLFVFDKPGLYAFWMKDMKFPLDIIFISGNKIVTVHRNLPVNNLTLYSPTEVSDKVLEINAGLSAKYGFKPGDTVILKNIK